ncbi:MAG TPA: tRNA lysidine(34) synthetase TilS [Acidimicrobiales bacterium]|nr:tRNA lysidine(34) synthetase TilS [Acidimicrobiales bacterium]
MSVGVLPVGDAGAPVADRARGAAAPFLSRCRFPDASSGPVSLAVSGGPDSVALMILARAAGLQGTVIHVDHGLRPGSAAEAPAVAAMAASLGFGFECRRVRVGPGGDLEARARRARYQALPAGVLTGHTMDDQAETVLLNVLRGAALDGLSGMRPGAGASGRGPAVGRPLLDLRRRETAGICTEAGFQPIQDPTNTDPRFRRNRIRTEVLPLLGDIAGRDLVPVLARQAELAAADVELLDELASAVDPVDVRSLRAAPPALARRALRSWLRSPRAGGGPEAHPPSSAELGRVMQVVDGTRRACQITGGRRVSRRAGRLTLSVDGGDA